MGAETAAPARQQSAAGKPPAVGTRVWLLVLLVALTTLAALAALGVVLGGVRSGPLEWLILALAAPLYVWLAIGFWTALAGYRVCRQRLHALPRREPSDASADASVRTALVVPVRDEDPEALIGCLERTCFDLIAAGTERHFEVFVLSDSALGPGLAAEAAAMAALQAQLGAALTLHYRRRAVNRGRKAGNIADFVRRWGGRYRYMVVLDADSVMRASTLRALVARMENDPGLGLLQTVSLPVGQRTLFGRCQQFAAWLQSRMLAAGQAWWLPGCSNYYGHNAIIRVSAFAASAALPTLPGAPPLGGEILSHDFVEAALLRRAGWRVDLVTDLGGSFEHMPSNLHDYARRERRWIQGNLQHLRLLGLPRLHPVSRLHFLVGVLGFIASPLWLLWMLAMSVRGALSLAAAGDGLAVAPDWSLQVAPALLLATVGLLLAPRLLALQLAWRGRAAECGGRLRLLASSLLETAWAVVTAPVLMLYHAWFVLGVVCRRSTPWTVQARCGRQAAWRDCLWHGLPMSALGLLWAAATLAIDTRLGAWMGLIWIGLLPAPLLLRWSGSGAAGDALVAAGWLRAPDLPGPAAPSARERPAPPAPRLRPPPPPAPCAMPSPGLGRESASAARGLLRRAPVKRQSNSNAGILKVGYVRTRHASRFDHG
jgi:membrane glycosyltransferase